MKTSIWKRFFRKGYDCQGGGYAARYDGWCAKTDKKSTRTKLNRLMDKLFNEEEK